MVEQYGHAAVNFLSSLREGAYLDDVADALDDVIARVRAEGRPGTVVLTLKISPTKSNPHMLFIADTIQSKPPKREAGETTLYATDDGQISRYDPRQPRLPGLVERPARGEPAAKPESEAAAGG